MNIEMKVKCIKELHTKHMTFKLNEEYTAQKVNEHWYCVDAVGISSNDFSKHFKPLVTYKTLNKSVVWLEEGGL